MEISVIVNLPNDEEDTFHMEADSLDHVLEVAKEENPNATSIVMTIVL